MEHGNTQRRVRWVSPPHRLHREQWLQGPLTSYRHIAVLFHTPKTFLYDAQAFLCSHSPFGHSTSNSETKCSDIQEYFGRN